MTDEEIRAWLTAEIETETLHMAEAWGPERRLHCEHRRDAFAELLAVVDTATSPNLWARAMGAK